ncbi:protein FAM200B-like [Diabrotica undecimpunctata]|uniref:protein FAM200B-like n=1 Tax=Diabrotica undecimpunctata TaxID=50387 RepID=UPI003B637BC7
MDTCIQENRKRSEESGESSNVNLNKKKKYRKYDQYLNFGFTCVTKVNVEFPQCVVYQKVLAAESVLSNKLKLKLKSIWNQLTVIYKTTALVSRASIPTKALLASYMVAYRIAKCKKPHTIAEELILPAAIGMVTVIIGESAAKEIKTIPFSNNTVSRRIHDMAKDINEQIRGKLSGLFAIQLKEATDSNDDV